MQIEFQSGDLGTTLVFQQHTTNSRRVLACLDEIPCTLATLTFVFLVGIAPRLEMDEKAKSILLGAPFPEPGDDLGVVAGSHMLPRIHFLASGPLVPDRYLESVIPMLRTISYLGREQFWGRAVRASRDSLNPGRFLFGPEILDPFKQGHVFCSSRFQAVVSGIEDDLILPAVPTGRGKWL